MMPKNKNRIIETKRKMSIVRKNKTWEEIYGEERAKEMKAKMSERNKLRKGDLNQL